MNKQPQISEAEITAYVDGELEPAAEKKLEAWFDAHPRDRLRMENIQRQNQALRALYDPMLDEPVPDEMLELVSRKKPRRTMPAWMQIAAAVTLLLAGSALGWGLRGAQDAPQSASLPGYVERAVGAHFIYASEVLHPVEVEASKEEHLVAWLSKRLGQPLKAPGLTATGFELMGGRLLEDAGDAAAQFMYEDNIGRRITVYLRQYDGRDTAFKIFQQDDVSAIYWISAPFAYALSGELPRPELMEVALKIFKETSP